MLPWLDMHHWFTAHHLKFVQRLRAKETKNAGSDYNFLIVFSQASLHYRGMPEAKAKANAKATSVCEAGASQNVASASEDVGEDKRCAAISLLFTLSE